MKKIKFNKWTAGLLASVLILVSVVSYTLAAEASLVIDSINGQPYPIEHCIAGTLTFVVHGVTGNNGGPYSLDLGNGFSTSTVNVVSGQNKAFNDITITYTPTSAGDDLYLILYHGSPSGQDSHALYFSQCTAAPTQGVVIVEKHVVNDSDGTATSSDFTLNLGGSFPGSAEGSDRLLTAGNYILSEGAATGYQGTIGGDCSADGSITVVAGENYICTITNDDVFVPNSAPVANDDSLSTDEDTPASDTLSATDADADSLTYSKVTNPTHGVVVIDNASTGAYTYTPDGEYYGPDSFTYKANDGTSDSSVHTVNITVNPVNDPPVLTLNGSNDVAVEQGDTYEDAGAVCTDIEDGSITPDMTSDVDTNTVGTYTVTYNCIDEDGGEATKVTRTVTVQEAPAQCSDESDNDEDEKTDATDPGCWTDPNDSETYNPEDNDETDPTDACANDAGIQTSTEDCTPAPEPETPSSSGHHRSGGNSPASTQGQVLGASCGLYMDRYIRSGRTNNAEQVMKLQTFLNKNMNSGLPITGFYGPLTLAATKAFQAKYAGDILTPWNLTSPTGIVYQTTLRHINNIECPDLMLEIPALIDWSKNPNLTV